MAKMLLVNPARRKRRNPTAAKRRPTVRRNPIANLARRRRRRNPTNSLVSTNPVGRRRRRRNPIAGLSRRRVMRRRRRNPIGGLNTSVLIAMFKDGAIGGAGAVGMDLLMGQLNNYLPITFQTVPGLPGVGDAVKAGITALLGQGLSRQTKGLSRKMAEGALAVQAHDIIRALLPASMAVGYYTPAQLVQGSARVGPSRMGMNGVRRYLPANAATPLLSKYMTAGGASPLLSRAESTAESEGFRYR